MFYDSYVICFEKYLCLFQTDTVSGGEEACHIVNQGFVNTFETLKRRARIMHA